MYDFLQEFAVRMAIVILIFFFLLQLVKLAGKVFRSRVMKIVFGACAKAIQWLANLSPAIAIVIGFFAWAGHMIAVAFKGFHEIEEGDGDYEVGEKIRANYLLGLMYDVKDYWESIFCASMVIQLNDLHWSFIGVFLATWLFDAICCTNSILACLKSGKDFTLGEAHRRAFEAVNIKSRMTGIVYKIIQHPMAIIWDGPEQLIFFYKKELRGFSRMAGATLFLTFFQGAFWAWLYSLGHETVTGLLRTIF